MRWSAGCRGAGRYVVLGSGLLLLLVSWRSYTVAERRGRRLLSAETDGGGGSTSVPSYLAFASQRHRNLPNCTLPAITQFPRDVFTQTQRRHGAILIHALLTLYMFLALAIVCDDYFVPSLEVICDYLHLQTDVAGATFMAAGSSAPELATSVIAVFIAKDDIGLGTVIGSAVYNIMFVISICALFAGMVVHLNWWPLIRDCIFYTLSILALLFVIMDGLVTWYEALVLLLLYLVYVVLMYFNPRLQSWFVPKVTCCKKRTMQVEEIVLYDKLQDKAHGIPASERDEIYAAAPPTTELPNVDSDYDSEDERDEYAVFVAPGYSDNEQVYSFGTDPGGVTELAVKKIKEPESTFKMPSGSLKQILWTISLPVITLLYISIPDCRKERFRRWFIVTFLFSLVWLSVFSFLMIWMITTIGYTLGIPDTVMGLTFIAFGVSVPDAIASFIVVREGLGDMAVSNAVGSNVFDILVCMGVPWLLSSLMTGQSIQVYSEGLTYSVLTLMSTVVFLLVATHLNGWKLDRKYGLVLMLVYILFTVLSVLYELNIFGYFHPPECPVIY